MTEALENENGLALLDQMLEDLAGDEFDAELFTLGEDLDNFSTVEDEFAEIDGQH